MKYVIEDGAMKAINIWIDKVFSDGYTTTGFCLISALGAFEIENESLLLFTTILH